LSTALPYFPRQTELDYDDGVDHLTPLIPLVRGTDSSLRPDGRSPRRCAPRDDENGSPPLKGMGYPD
jgi:hypothetical protein